MAGACFRIVLSLLLVVLTVGCGQRHSFHEKFLELKPKGRGAQSKRKRTNDADDDTSGNEDEPADPKKAPPPAPGSDFFSILMKPILEKFAMLGNPKSAAYQEYALFRLSAWSFAQFFS